MGTKLNAKQLVLIGFILSSLMIVSLFQNCGTMAAKPNKPIETAVDPADHFTTPDREPASDLSTMIQASDREIIHTRQQLDENLNKEGGFGSQNRKVANKDDADLSETQAVEDKDNLNVKLRTKKVKHRKH